MVTEQEALVKARMTDRIKLFVEGLTKHKACFRYYLSEGYGLNAEVKGIIELYQSQVSNSMVLQLFTTSDIDSDMIKAFMELVLKQGLEIVLFDNSVLENRIYTTSTQTGIKVRKVKI